MKSVMLVLQREENHDNDLQSNAKGDKSLLWVLLAIVTAIPTAVLTLFATFDFNLGKDPVTKECRTTIQPVLHWNLELPTIICLICILALLWIVFTSKSNTTKKDHMHSEIFIAAQLLSTFLMSSMFFFIFIFFLKIGLISDTAAEHTAI